MKIHSRFAIQLLSCLFIASSACAQETPDQKDTAGITELVLLPTIHRNHEKTKFYTLKRLETVIRDIKPEIVCTEITPPSLETYDKGKQDPRLSLFPEYTKVILPLRKELKYKVVPCSAYTKKINFRTVGIKAMDKAHYSRIAETLDHYQGQGKKILITFGSGHINGLLEHLRLRKDIKIIDYRPTLEKLRKAPAQ